MELDELIVISEGEVGERLDKLLAQRFKNFHSRTYFQYLIDQGLVLLNGESVKKRTKPQVGDEIEVRFASLPSMELLPEAIPLNILYEDDHLLAVNKPAGMVTHPAVGNWSGTFVNALLYHCNWKEGNYDSLRPGIVHRLDKETSGVMVAAKTLEMQQKLIALFSARQIYKEYLAICVGKPSEGELIAAIGRHPVNRKEMTVLPSGKSAISSFKVIKCNHKLSLVRAVITTGRTHQIRVHLKYLKTPVLGDPIYGNQTANRDFKIERQLLHSHLLKFKHPLTGKELVLSAPLPADMNRIIDLII